MWINTKQIVDAPANSVKQVTFVNSEHNILSAKPSCGCSSVNINGKEITLNINTGPVAYGNSKIKKVHADVKTTDNVVSRLRVEINVHANTEATTG